MRGEHNKHANLAKRFVSEEAKQGVTENVGCQAVVHGSVLSVVVSVVYILTQHGSVVKLRAPSSERGARARRSGAAQQCQGAKLAFRLEWVTEH